MKKVLIVDDEPNILLSLRFLMEKAGYDVVTLTDGSDALVWMEQEQPDLLLLDIMLPSISGLGVCVQIRAHKKWDNVKIILLTAKGQDVDIKCGLAAGADGYITKPFSTRELTAEIEQLLKV